MDAERFRGLVDRRLASRTSVSGRSESRPATGSGSSAVTSPPSTTTIPPPSSTSRATAPPSPRRRRRRRQVVGVVGDRRAERAALEAEAAHEPEPDPAGTVMALQDGDLREVARPGRRPPSRRGRRARADERVGDDLVGTRPITRASPPAHGMRKASGRAADADRVAHPVGDRPAGTRRPAARASARARGRTSPGPAGRACRPGSRGDCAQRAQAVVEGRLSEAITSASSAGMPSATASRTIELMCPSSAMCSGSRSSVQKAMRRAVSARAGSARAGSAPPTPRGSGATCRRGAARGLPRPRRLVVGGIPAEA